MTISLTVNSGVGFRKWDRLKTSSDGIESVVIGVKKEHHSTSIRLYPIEEVACGKFGRWIWWKVLKLLVYLKLT